jgi:hypothetical protein
MEKNEEKKKVNKLAYISTGFCVLASIGVDAILTGIAATAVPKTFGLPGLAQKVCIKAGTIGLSLVVGDAIDNTISKYAKSIADQIYAALDEQVAV